MSKIRQFLRVLLWAVIISLGGLFLLGVLAGLLMSTPGFLDAAFHIVGGFWFFLDEKLPAITSDAGTWGPGLAAWLVALALGHRFLRDWAQARGFQWRVTTTTCLGLLLPVLFAISFIVPGILLQVNGLRKVRWFEREVHNAAAIKMELRNLTLACAGFANLSADGKYPDSLDALAEPEFMSLRFLNIGRDNELPPEPFTYLGTGYTRDTSGDALLAISPWFQDRGTWQRMVVTIDGTMIVIRDDEVDAWLDRVVPR